MINTINYETNTYTQWEQLQQPLHGNGNQADTLRLLAALDEGWQIQEAASYLAHGSNAEGLGYLLTLYHPKRGQTRECSVTHNADIDALLAFENVTGLYH